VLADKFLCERPATLTGRLPLRWFHSASEQVPPRLTRNHQNWCSDACILRRVPVQRQRQAPVVRREDERNEVAVRCSNVRLVSGNHRYTIRPRSTIQWPNKTCGRGLSARAVHALRAAPQGRRREPAELRGRLRAARSPLQYVIQASSGARRAARLIIARSLLRPSCSRTTRM
jgi:hypothetical protein